jgi:hypothetical protein
MVAFGCCLSMTIAAAQQPTVRPPLGQSPQGGRESHQVPKELGAAWWRSIAQATPGHSARFINLGNSRLTLSYWDAAGKWHDISVASGSFGDVKCEKCGSTINIVYNNGRNDKATRATVGRAYGIFWSTDQQVWDLAELERR